MRTIKVSDEVYEKLLDEVWVAATEGYLPEWWNTVDITPGGERLFVCCLLYTSDAADE